MSTGAPTIAYDPNDRLAEAIATFEVAFDAGSNPDPQEWLGRYSDVAAKLADYFRQRRLVLDVAGARAEPTEALPAQVGSYRVEGEITRGGMGRIVRIHDDAFDRPLAMKTLLARDPGLEARFDREARITALLQHPGIPPVHARGLLDDGRPYFIMKLIQGSSLAELLKGRANPAAELPRFIGIFEQICQTVGYAHSRRVIHRDLKPANVMVGAFGEVQVLDWGLAKVLDQGGGEPGDAQALACGLRQTVVPADATAAHTRLGTLPYISPEAARGEVDALDARADVFGLGGILCEILTGEPPFTGRDYVEKALRGDLADTRARLGRSGADAELYALACRCLTPWKEYRLADGAAVASAVAAYQAELARRLRQAELDRAAAEARAQEEHKLRKAEEAERYAERKRRRMAYALVATVFLLLVAAFMGIAGLSEMVSRQRIIDHNGALLAQDPRLVLLHTEERLSNAQAAAQAARELVAVRDGNGLVGVPTEEREAWLKVSAELDCLLKEVRADIAETALKGSLTDTEGTQIHELKLAGGKTYVIDLHGSDSFRLRLDDDLGVNRAWPGERMPGNISRLIFTPTEDGTYWLRVESWLWVGSSPAGAYTLRVRAVGSNARRAGRFP
jgi:tRNA A-37 threonylcarbamoyl transferase component Bud32